MSAIAPNVVDVTDATFEQVVIDGSRERPVVVDLWADWCGPCRTLGPILERVARDKDGAFLLARVDIDRNEVGQALLQAVRSQGIPTVVAFRAGEPVDMFIGAYPEEAVRSFVDALLPSEADLAAQEAKTEVAAGDLDAAEREFRTALEKDPENVDAKVGLAGILADRGDLDEAEALVTPLLPHAGAERVAARVRVARWEDEPGPGTLASAKRLAGRGRWRDALDAMLAALPDDPEARQAMVDVFWVLGDDDPLVAEYRRRLANALF
jgi:putative thioredoxin